MDNYDVEILLWEIESSLNKINESPYKEKIIIQYYDILKLIEYKLFDLIEGFDA